MVSDQLHLHIIQKIIHQKWVQRSDFILPEFNTVIRISKIHKSLIQALPISIITNASTVLYRVVRNNSLFIKVDQKKKTKFSITVKDRDKNTISEIHEIYDNNSLCCQRETQKMVFLQTIWILKEQNYDIYLADSISIGNGFEDPWIYLVKILKSA